MTDFAALDIDDLGVDRIGTSPTAFALYDNLFAFAEKATGAPVLANNYVVTAMIANSQVTAAKLAAGSGEVSWVAARTIDIGAGGVGSYALAEAFASGLVGPLAFGATVAGSNLLPVNADYTQFGSALSGTWRCLGRTSGSPDAGSATLFLRIA